MPRKHQVKVTCTSKSGGAVTLSAKPRVWASYAVAGISGLPAPEILYASADLKDGRTVQFFLNRETNLIVVDVIDHNGKGGCEIVRRTV